MEITLIALQIIYLVKGFRFYRENPLKTDYFNQLPSGQV